MKINKYRIENFGGWKDSSKDPDILFRNKLLFIERILCFVVKIIRRCFFKIKFFQVWAYYKKTKKIKLKLNSYYSGEKYFSNMCKQSSNPPFIFKSKGGIEKCFVDHSTNNHLSMRFIHKVEDCILELTVFNEPVIGDDGKFDNISEEVENFLSGITLK